LNKFVLQADAPRVDKLPAEEILGVTVVLVTCSYREREFVRIGYYVNNEYIPEEPTEDPEQAQKNFDPSRHLGRVQRQILADKPRVTKFPIPWGDATVENTEPMIDQSQSRLKDLPMQEGTPSTVATMEMDE
jgi:histone chaperone ASF1